MGTAQHLIKLVCLAQGWTGSRAIRLSVLSLLFLLAVASTSVISTISTDRAPAANAQTVVGPQAADLSDAQQQAILDAYEKLPLSFEKNQGQTDAEVRFRSRGSGYALFLAPGEAVLTLSRNPSEARPKGRGAGSRGRGQESGDLAPAVVRMELLNANPTPRLVPEAEQGGEINYLIGNDPGGWHTGIPRYGRVVYQEVYPGIDWVFQGNPQQLEYDFVVHPGADPDDIVVGFEGAEDLSIDPRGDLVLRLPDGDIRHRAPYIYQEIDGTRHGVPGRYVRRDGSHVGFEVDAYDPTRPLIIDPIVEFSVYLGGGAVDVITDIALDSNDDIYVVGHTDSDPFPTLGPAQGSLAGGVGDTFVTKLNAEGTAVIFSTYLGGGGLDEANAMALDAAGSVYFTGITNSSDFPITPGALDRDCGTDGDGVCESTDPDDLKYAEFIDAFVARLSSDGSSLVFSTYLGGSGDDWGLGIAVDDQGSAYIAGSTWSYDDVGMDPFPTKNAFQSVNGSDMSIGYWDAFVTKLSQDGTLDYSTYLGGSSDEDGFAVAVDQGRNAYVTGITWSDDFPTQSPFQAGNAGDADAYVAKLGPAGDRLVFSSYLGDIDYNEGLAIALDSSGDAYVAGDTWAGGVVFDVFVTKVAGNGSGVLYSALIRGSGDDFAFDVAVDAAGSAHVVGATQSFDFPTVDAAQDQRVRRFDAFVAKLTGDGSGLEYSTYFGGSSEDAAFGIALDSAGDAVVAGVTESPDQFPLVPPPGGSLDPLLTKDPPTGLKSGDLSDGFLVKLMPTPPVPGFSKRFGPGTIEAAETSTLVFTIDNTPSTVAASSLDFTDNLPAGMTVATPANASTDCTDGTLTAADGASVITYTGGTVSAAASCSVSVDVTADVGTHESTTEDLTFLWTSSGGNSGTATDSLTVNPPPVPGFSKSFAPGTILVGETSTLVFTIDNTASPFAADSLDFTDNLPAGMTVAAPANASTDCSGGTLTAAAGGGIVTYTGGTVSAGASCTVAVDVTSSTVGTHVNTTGDLTSSAGSSGTASDSLQVRPRPPDPGDAPMAQKATVLENLKSLLPTGDKKDDKKIDKAIKFVNKSLAANLWETGSTLTRKGRKVFDGEKKAVKELLKVDGGTNVSGEIAALVNIDQVLAQFAIDLAIAAPGDAKEIAKALKEMGKAAEEIGKGHLGHAIDKYKKAWEHAQKALKKGA